MFSDGVMESGHSGAIVDVSVDASGMRLATASEDGTVRLYDCDDHNNNNSENKNATPSSSKVLPAAESRCTWKYACSVGGGDGPLCCVAWAPSVFYSSAFVACTENGQLTLWSDVSTTRQYEKVYSYTLPSPGWCAAWAPQEYGKLFAVGCADGSLFVFTGQESTWDVHSFHAHQRGCCSLSFAPFFPPGALLMAPLESEVPTGASAPPISIAPPRLVTCGAGRSVKVWVHAFEPSPEEGAPPLSVWNATPLQSPVGATGWREVAWAPSVGLPFTYVAAATEDGHVSVWSQDGPFRPEQAWQCKALPQHSDSVTRLSWSLAGTLLLVSCADGTAAMWKETACGEWEMVSKLENPLVA